MSKKISAKCTIMNSLADSLKNFDVDGSRTSVITIIVFIIANDTPGTLFGGRHHGCTASDARDNETDIEARNGWIRVDIVRVKDLWK